MVESIENVADDNDRHLVLVGGKFIVHSKLLTQFEKTRILTTNQTLAPSKELEGLNSLAMAYEAINLHSRLPKPLSSEDSHHYNQESFSFTVKDSERNSFQVNVASQKDISKKIYYS